MLSAFEQFPCMEINFHKCFFFGEAQNKLPRSSSFEKNKNKLPRKRGLLLDSFSYPFSTIRVSNGCQPLMGPGNMATERRKIYVKTNCTLRVAMIMRWRTSHGLPQLQKLANLIQLVAVSSSRQFWTTYLVIQVLQDYLIRHID